MWLFLAVVCLIQQAAESEFINKRHLNPQTFMTVSEIIQYWGYPNEEYEILTDDGYYLKANRIPHGASSPAKSGSKPVVLLVPGVVMEGRCWIANLPDNSLGFVLADAGYDVWIINNRGTTWSRRHQNLTVDQEEFWNFSFHEMAMSDIPATINFILQKAQQEELYYIGHSQGAAIGLIAFSAMPELGRRVKLMMCLAPAYILEGTRGPMRQLLSLPDGLRKLIWGKKEFSFLSNSQKTLVANLCSFPILDKICIHLIFLCAGYNAKSLNVSKADVYLGGSYPDFSSMKTITHWSQIAKSNEFKYFDYGDENKVVYNMTKPPLYKIEDLMVPTALWSGGNDIIVDAKDVEQLLPQVTNLVFHKNIPDWNHADFLWGLDAPQCLYKDVLRLMEMYT
uniref:Lipase n=1 Tax=Pogona vitticeps TaxID=103695 RepID=A0A6J0UFQ9_9SAUR